MPGPLEDAPGAVFDGEVLLHLGNPLGEQRALHEGTALAPLGDRAVIAVTGEDRLGWLDSLTSQSVARLEPADSTELLILDPQGHVEHAAGVVDDGATTWLIVDRERESALREWLTRMRFRLRVEIAPADDMIVIGGTRAAVAGLPAVAVWVDPWPEPAAGGWAYAHPEPHPGRDRDWAEALVPADRLSEALAGASLAGTWAADALRVAAWRPRAGNEADGRTLPHEVDWLRTAVHLSKGCYRGQETVAKVHNLGHPPRRLVSLQLDGSDALLPERGDEVRAGEAPVGVITSAVRHYEQGPIALALVKRTVAEDAPLTVVTGDGEIAAMAETIVPPDAGRTAAVPRMPRLGRR